MVTTGSPIRIVNELMNVMDSRGNLVRFHKSGIKIADAFSEPRRLVTLLFWQATESVARIRDRFDLPALDKNRSQRKGKEPRAHQHGDSQD